MGEGWQLLKIRGIPLRIHPSWFVILGLATVAFQQQYSQELSGSGTSLELWGLGLLTAVLLFVFALVIPRIKRVFSSIGGGVASFP